MSRFVLIDPWLADLGGHNYQYALNVLAAAEQMGHEPVLAVNQSLPPAGRFPSHWTVMRPFHFGVWTRHWLGPDGRNPHPCALNGDWLPDGKASWLARRLDWLARRDRRRRIRDFAQGCSYVLDQIAPRSRDVFFLPSLSEFDFVGLARFLCDDPRSLDFPWHLQFHFNIFVGRDPEYASQQEGLAKFQRQFGHALQAIPQHRLRFYATTEHMARQYEHIGIGPFEPLPYPVEPTPACSQGKTLPIQQKPQRHDRPLQVAFAGGMRREKGKKKVVSLIESVWDDCLASGRMRFVFQAKPAQLIRRLPRALRSHVAPLNDTTCQAPLATVPHPLDADSYAQFIRTTDLAVFMYDSRRYYARASGILCEMLAAGIPAIVPAGCWLADQISPGNEAYLETLAGEVSNIVQSWETRASSDNAWRDACSELPPTASDLLIQTSWPVGWPAGTFLSVVAEFRDEPRSTSGPTERFIVNRPAGEFVRVLVPIPERVSYVRIEISSAYSRQSLPGEHAVRCIALGSPAADTTRQHRPRGSVGLIAANEDQYPELLRDMLRHYDHYRLASASFARVWCDRHHPKRTVAALMARDGGCEVPSQPHSHVTAQRIAM